MIREMLPNLYRTGAGYPRFGTIPPLNLRKTWPFWVSFAVLAAIGANNVVESVTDWHLHDMYVYRDAALRSDLYGGDVTPLNAYRYAPWFAYAWKPLAILPGIEVVWSAAMLAASWFCIRPLLGWDRIRVCLLLLFAPMLFAISAGGNVQPLMVAGLMYGLPSRWAWAAIGLAASLKIAPLAFVAVLLAERRWKQAIAAVLLAGALWAPILAFSVDPVTWDSGVARTLPAPLWLAVAGVSAGFALYLAWRRSPMTHLAAGAAAILALPRLFMYELAILLPASRQGDADESGHDGRSPTSRSGDTAGPLVD